MKLPEQLEAGLGWTAAFLDRWLPRSAYAIGGGTILAARWHHRLSTDIDLFVEEQALNDALKPNAWREIGEALDREAIDETITDLVLSSTGFSFITSNGPISFYSIPYLTANAISSEREDSTGIYAEHSAEILFEKLRGRMVNASRYVARDLYDVVVSYGVERASLDTAMATLSSLERDSLRYDVEQGDASVGDLHRVLAPAYPELVSDLERFNLVAGEILAQNVTATTDRFLMDVGVSS